MAGLFCLLDGLGPGYSSSLLELAVRRDRVNRIVAPTTLLLECGARKGDDCLDQTSLHLGHIISKVQARLHVLIEFKPQELELDFADRILYALLLSQLL